MTTGSGDNSGGGGFARQWEALRADSDIQFAPVQLPEQNRDPTWLQRFFDWLGELLSPIGQLLDGMGQTLLWMLAAVAVAGVAWLAWRTFGPDGTTRTVADDAEPGWAPERGAARELLAEADSLAALGRYDEATHLLLLRSVQQIEAARPGLVERSSTARDIAALPALSGTARGAFGAIAERVERSLFALRKLTVEDWTAARAAYADLALDPPSPAAAA